MSLLASRSIDGLLEATEQAALDQHLGVCPACRVESQALRRTDRLARQSLESLTPDSRDLSQRVLAMTSAPSPSTRSSGADVAALPWRKIAWGGTAAAAAILLTIGALRFLDGDAADAPAATAGPAGHKLAPGTPTDEHPRISPFAAVSCEVDPRGVDIHWDDIATEEIQSFVVERFDGHGGRETFETDQTRLLDTGIQPGEEYFYVVRQRPEEEPLAYRATMDALGVGAITVDAVDDNLRVRFVDGTKNFPVLEVMFESKGQAFSHRFPTKLNDRVGSAADIPGRGSGDFRTHWFLVAIDWEIERTVLDPETGLLTKQMSRAVRLERSGPGPAADRQIQLWIRD